MSTELALIEVKTPALVFVKNGCDPIIERIKAEVAKEQPNLDISTPTGRKAIASLAYKIAQSKTKLDEIGKALTVEQRAAIDAVNEERSRVWTELETLQKSVRQPLTDWEEAEKKRVADHEEAILVLKSHQFLDTETSAEGIERQITSLIEFGKSRNFEEFAVRAQMEHKISYDHLLSMLAKKKKADEDAAELTRLKAAEEERQIKEREEAAADKARKEAEEAAAAEAKRVADQVEADKKAAAEREENERKEKEAAQKRADDAEAARIASEKKAEEDKKAAAAKAEADKKKAAEDAAQAERDKAAKIKADEEAATKKREADQEHKKKINNEAYQSLLVAVQKAGFILSPEDTKAIVIAIAKGEIKNISIKY